MLNLVKDKVIIYSIIYSVCIIIIDRLKITGKYKFEPLKLLNYIVWFGLSLFAFLNKAYQIDLLKFCSTSIVLNFSYENIFYPEDFGHTLHHILTIFTILIAYLTNAVRFDFIIQIVNIFYVAFLSSIFSSIRKLSKISYGIEDIKSIISYNSYKLSYIFSKSWGIIAHYSVLLNNLSIIPISPIFISLFLLTTGLHILQVWFIYLMLR